MTFSSDRTIQLTPDVQITSRNSDKKVAILLCTYNGAKYLGAQLDSIIDQSHKNWVIYASDDGSEDSTLTILNDYKNIIGENRLVIFSGPRSGFAKNFLSLITNSEVEGSYFAFSDQDDIWEKEKLTRSIASIDTIPSQTPGMYCSRAKLIDENNIMIGMSPLRLKPPGFRNALVQSLAGANTMLINESARELLKLTGETREIIAHDWLTYFLVTGCGGQVIYDPVPTIAYRQHANNLIGGNIGLKERLKRIKKITTGRFKNWSDKNLLTLKDFEKTLTSESIYVLTEYQKIRNNNVTGRLRHLKNSGVYRQNLLGNTLLFTAALLNKL